MRRLTEGRGSCVVFLDSLSLYINGFDIVVKSVKGVHLLVNFLYESLIKATEDEPGCGEWVELLSVYTEKIVVFTNNAGIVLSLDSTTDLLQLLDSKQYEKLVSLLTDQDGTTRRGL